MNFFFVALGGSIGAVVRYGIYLMFQPSVSGFPIGTALANSLGCFVAGFALPYLQLNPSLKPFIGFGFLGALTTFSTFSVEIIQLVEAEKYLTASLYWIFGAFLCLGFCALGVTLGQRLCTP